MTYDHLTDEELLRHADGQSGLIKALCERLEMRIREVEDLAHTMPEPSNIRQLDLFEENNNA
jgi:hypothetical protein